MALERPTSEDGIANLILGKCLEDEIATLDDDLARARVVRQFFASERDALLRRFDWNFASTWCRPAADAGTPTGLFTVRYPLPDDCLAVREVESLSDAEWGVASAIVSNAGVEVEAMVLECDAASAHVRYTRKVTTVRLWDPLFLKAFVGLCAGACAGQLGRSIRQAQSYTAEAEQLLAPMAMRADSKEKAPDKVARVKLNPWLRARFGIRRDFEV